MPATLSSLGAKSGVCGAGFPAGDFWGLAGGRACIIGKTLYLTQYLAISIVINETKQNGKA
jgi:hypothetical protein